MRSRSQWVVIVQTLVGKPRRLIFRPREAKTKRTIRAEDGTPLARVTVKRKKRRN